MLKQFRQKHRKNHQHGYYKPAWTDAYRTIIGILHSEEIKPSAGENALYLSVNIFSIESYRDTIFHLLLEKGRPFYMYIDIQAMCRSGNLQDKGSTCTFFLSVILKPWVLVEPQE